MIEAPKRVTAEKSGTRESSNPEMKPPIAASAPPGQVLRTLRFGTGRKNHTRVGVTLPLSSTGRDGLRTKSGSITAQVGHVIDIMPTCMELAGAEYPDSHNGHTLTPLDGKTLMPILENKERKGHERLFFEHMGGRAIIEGDFKLVALENRPWEPYNLSEDRTEMENLAAKHPDRVQAMGNQWGSWIESVLKEP